jgi:branched-chain amino acid transport system permease protein
VILDIIITSLIHGSIYALLAIGFPLIVGVARIVNIAHTAFYMVAAYCIYYVTYNMGYHPIEKGSNQIFEFVVCDYLWLRFVLAFFRLFFGLV